MLDQMTRSDRISPEDLDRAHTAAEQAQSTLISALLSVARRWPDRVAIEDRETRVTYQQLADLAGRIGSALASAALTTAQPVALLLDSGPLMVAAMLGALHAGHFYLPLDPANPVARLATMLDDSTATVLLTDSSRLHLARDVAQSLAATGGALQVLNIEELSAGSGPRAPMDEGATDSPVWLLYTSGSTGKPKGVIQTNRNVLQYVDNYTNGLRITPDDRFALLFSCAVNAGAHVIFSTLLNGATLCMYDVRRRGSADLADWLKQQRITLYASVPTLFRDWARRLDSRDESFALRYVMLIGEPVYASDLELFRLLRAPGCTLINRLGSTETGSILWHFCQPDEILDGPHLPVGLPVKGNEILLLDECGEPVAVGQVGEITVRSRYLSPGYWRRPELTARLFHDEPGEQHLRHFHTGDLGRRLPNGSYLCLGRRDWQLKVRGYRIEAGEVEAALLGCPAVQEAIVVGHADSEGETRLVAYYRPAPEHTPTVGELRRWLLPRLPEHMVPSVFVPLTSWPLAPNGKVDRRALPPPGAQRPLLDSTYVAPRTALEHDLVKLWQRTLSIEPIGVLDPFVDLGGTSILAMRIVAAISSRLSVRLPLRTFFEAGTVAALATTLEKSVDAAAGRLSEQRP